MLSDAIVLEKVSAPIETEASSVAPIDKDVSQTWRMGKLVRLFKAHLRSDPKQVHLLDPHASSLTFAGGPVSVSAEFEEQPRDYDLIRTSGDYAIPQRFMIELKSVAPAPPSPSGMVILPKGIEHLWCQGSYALSALSQGWADLDWSSSPAPEDPQWRAIKSKVAGFADLEEDWDSMEGVAPEPDVIRGVSWLIEELEELGAPAPSEAYASGDGEIGLRWRSVDGFASASFTDDGSLLAYVRSSRLAKPFSLEADWKSLPSLYSFARALTKR